MSSSGYEAELLRKVTKKLEKNLTLANEPQYHAPENGIFALETDTPGSENQLPPRPGKNEINEINSSIQSDMPIPNTSGYYKSRNSSTSSRSNGAITPLTSTTSNETNNNSNINNTSKRPYIHSKLSCNDIKSFRSSSLVHSNSASSVLQKWNNEGEIKSVKSHTELAETANGVRMLARNLAKATIQLDVRNIMIVTKAKDNSLIFLTREVAEWLLRHERQIIVHVDRKLAKLKRFNASGLLESLPEERRNALKFWGRTSALRNPESFDLVVTLGGDGTILYVSNLFQRVVPPVISFSLGSLGFLTNFQFDQFREEMSLAIECGVRAYLRMRFTCRVHKADGTLVCEQQVLNELVVDRGPSPYVTNLELYGDGSLLTVVQADGVIIATPTGSTAYSLSAGGSLVHPGVSAISVTPICPHTLSFRPVLLPDGMLLKLKVPESTRSTAWASFDGKVRTELSQGDYVTIQASPYPFPTVLSSKNEFFERVSRNLNWNVREIQKPFASLLKEGELINATDNDDAEFDIDDIDDDGSDIEFTANPETELYNSYSSLFSDEDRCYIPDFGKGINTPPSHNSHMEERTCYAHPNARVTMGWGENS